MADSRAEILHRRLVTRAKREGVSLNLLTVSLLAEALGARDARKSVRARGAARQRRSA